MATHQETVYLHSCSFSNVSVLTDRCWCVCLSRPAGLGYVVFSGSPGWPVCCRYLQSIGRSRASEGSAQLNHSSIQETQSMGTQQEVEPGPELKICRLSVTREKKYFTSSAFEFYVQIYCVFRRLRIFKNIIHL